jgi:hypothetical protein
MDPRSKTTAAELEQQQTLGLEVFGKVRRSRQTLAEMTAVKASLDQLAGQLKDKPTLQAQREKLATSIGEIQKGSKSAPDVMGLEAASGGLQSALRVVESGDRTTPQQAIEVYQLSDKAASSRIDQWNALKGGELAQFNQALEKAGLHGVKISEIEEAEELLAR